jgi:hypothetical protein
MVAVVFVVVDSPASAADAALETSAAALAVFVVEEVFTAEGFMAEASMADFETIAVFTLGTIQDSDLVSGRTGELTHTDMGMAGGLPVRTPITVLMIIRTKATVSETVVEPMIRVIGRGAAATITIATTTVRSALLLTTGLIAGPIPGHTKAMLQPGPRARQRLMALAAGTI